jgi:hypothetical protein
MLAREQKNFEGIEEEKNFKYLKFDGGLNDNIVYAVCSDQNMHQLEPIHYA